MKIITDSVRSGRPTYAPGGCTHCDAYQTITKLGHDLWHVTVYHDDWCPVMAQITASVS